MFPSHDITSNGHNGYISQKIKKQSFVVERKYMQYPLVKEFKNEYLVLL